MNTRILILLAGLLVSTGAASANGPIIGGREDVPTDGSVRPASEVLANSGRDRVRYELTKPEAFKQAEVQMKAAIRGHKWSIDNSLENYGEAFAELIQNMDAADGTADEAALLTALTNNSTTFMTNATTTRRNEITQIAQAAAAQLFLAGADPVWIDRLIALREESKARLNAQRTAGVAELQSMRAQAMDIIESLAQ